MLNSLKTRSYTLKKKKGGQSKKTRIMMERYDMMYIYRNLTEPIKVTFPIQVTADVRFCMNIWFNVNYLGGA